MGIFTGRNMLTKVDKCGPKWEPLEPQAAQVVNRKHNKNKVKNTHEKS
jgi:hypothetical protein